jgi:hypothetical protein
LALELRRDWVACRTTALSPTSELLRLSAFHSKCERLLSPVLFISYRNTPRYSMKPAIISPGQESCRGRMEVHRRRGVIDEALGITLATSSRRGTVGEQQHTAAGEKFRTHRKHAKLMMRRKKIDRKSNSADDCHYDGKVLPAGTTAFIN